jgi:hypothetical protein
LNINVPIQTLFIIVPLIYFTEALPISINGFGVREGAFVFFFLQINHTKEEALALSLLVISIRYLYTMIVGGPFFAQMIFSFHRKKAKI